MRLILFLSSIFIILISSAQADVFCARNKARVRNGKIKFAKSIRIKSVTCDRGFTEILNTDVFKGSTGADGNFTSGVPAGETLKGYYDCGDTADAGNEVSSCSVSFLVTFKAALTSHFIPFGDPTPTECPGSATAPTAAAGHLCVYEGKSTNVGGAETNTFTLGDATSRVEGFGIFVLSTAAGDYASTGTWAATEASS